MNINKLQELFEINFEKIHPDRILEIFKLCFKYHSRLFDDNFFNINLSTPKKFLKFIKDFNNNIFCASIGKGRTFAGFFYIYDIKCAYKGTFDTKVTFCISRPYWGFGSYIIAKKGINFLFKELNIRKLTVEIVGENTLAKSLLEKLDFEFEAVLKKECIKRGCAENLYIFSKFNPAIGM